MTQKTTKTTLTSSTEQIISNLISPLTFFTITTTSIQWLEEINIIYLMLFIPSKLFDIVQKCHEQFSSSLSLDIKKIFLNYSGFSLTFRYFFSWYRLFYDSQAQNLFSLKRSTAGVLFNKKNFPYPCMYLRHDKKVPLKLLNKASLSVPKKKGSRGFW